MGSNQVDAVISGEMIEEARKLIGLKLRRQQYVTEASIDTMVGFVRSIGGRNPLYMEETYARDTIWGNLIAQPTFLYCIDDTFITPKFPGIHAIYGGGEWEFFAPVRLGDMLKSEARLIEVIEKEGRFCGRMVLEIIEVNYWNQYGSKVAIARSHIFRTPRAEAKRIGKYANVNKYIYTDAEMANIADSYDAEKIRGNRPRYWEDVKEGDELESVVKGPLTSEDMRFFLRSTRGILPFGYWVEYLRRHPAAVYWDPVYNMPDSWGVSLLKDSVAQEFGFPAAHDTGYQRICWMDNLVTNWMSDMSFLKKLSAKIIFPNIYADTTWAKGKIARKHIDGKQSIVDINIWCENQRGEVTATGTATVVLPSRSLELLPPVLAV
jgi:acyl dehydratase